LQTIAVVEQTAPRSIASTIPALTPFVKPKSSALITSRFTIVRPHMAAGPLT
jgi:hypothetical protein